MTIICLFGPDGSGKSTIARKLSESYRSRGVNIKVRWMRGTHTLASVLVKVVLKRYLSGDSTNPFQNLRVPAKMRGLWQVIEFFSTLPVILSKFVIPSLFGSFIVAERFSVDYVIWVSQVTDDKDYVNSFAARFYLALARKTRVRLYVTATIDELANRSKLDRASLSTQVRFYDYSALALNAYKLDTTFNTADQSLNIALDILAQNHVW